MALDKRTLPIPLALALNTKADPWQLNPGEFLELVNVVYGEDKRLRKRDGFGSLTSLPANSGVTTLTTHSGNLLGLGTSLYAYSRTSDQWLSQGRLQPLSLAVQPLARGAYSQTAADAAVASNGAVCCAFIENGVGYYTILDGQTQQSLVARTALPSTAAEVRVFAFAAYFLVTFLAIVSGTPKLQYIAIPLANLTAPSAPTDISAQVSGVDAAYDAAIDTGNTRLYFTWNGSDLGGAIRLCFLDEFLFRHSTFSLVGQTADLISLAIDPVTPLYWITWYTVGTSTLTTTALTTSNVTVLSPTAVASDNINHITSVVEGTTLRVLWESTNTYVFGPVRSDYTSARTVTPAGTLGTPYVVARSVGLASHAFRVNSITYVLGAYAGALQPTYFLLEVSSGDVVCKLAYSNAGGYVVPKSLPSASVNGSVASIAYLFAAQLTAVNKAQGVANVNGIYAQTGVNLAAFDLTNSKLITAEIGGSLHIAAGFLWQYDGVKPVEHGFHLWPEDVNLSSNPTTGGSLAAQIYFYSVVYEWTDAAGMLHRSAPSIPLKVDLHASGTATNSVVLDIPTARLTYKAASNPIRIVVYRWSTAQQNYFQATSVTTPLLNNPAVDSIQFTDILADASILGNQLLYTTGGVVENIAAPACIDLALYKSRLVALTAEDRNLLWYSKQVIEGTPVETTDLFTLYVAPTTGSQSSTGPTTAITAMDDKLLAFKASAPYYFTGQGPNNLGAQNDFSDPIYINGTAGTTNPFSTVLTPDGVMYQSSQGIWLLGRNLSTSYVGQAVEAYTNMGTAVAALSVPGTTQVRISLDSGIKVMYDYLFQKWGTFEGVPAVSSTLYQGHETYLDAGGHVFQQTPDRFVDGSRPTRIRIKTGWLNLGGLQGFQRVYEMFVAGEYYSPHRLQVSLGYNYNPSASQSVLIKPINASLAYGLDAFYGQGTPYGGAGSLEQWRIYPKVQKCQAMQITIEEQPDPTSPLVGEGLSLAGLLLLTGVKGSYPRIPAKRSIG